MLASSLLSLLFASAALANPHARRGKCDISKATVDLPPGQSAMTEPTTKPSFIAVAIGTQNYTCINGKYSNIGALAELFDISCLYNTAAFDRVQDFAIQAWKAAPPFVTPQTLISVLHAVKAGEILGQHYHVANPSGSGIIAKWDFTSQGQYAGNSNAYVLAAKTGGLTAPTGTQDIDWVSLKAVQGALAEEVYRTDTREGQPPASCVGGSPDITVKYAAKYWLFGGSMA